MTFAPQRLPMAKKPQPNKLQAAVASATAKQSEPSSIQTVSQTTFQGPIPSPDALDRYNKVIPGAAERILKMAESETAHRHQQEIQTLNANVNAQTRQLDIAELQTKKIYRSDTIGQALGFTVSIACIVGSVTLALNNLELAAAALAAIPTAAVIRAFFSPRPGQNAKH